MVTRRVLLCFYPRPVRYNHGIALLSAICKAQGIEVDIYMLDTLPRFQQMLVAKRYDMVGFSASIKLDYDLCRSFIELALLHGYQVMLGGTYFRRNNPCPQFDGRCLICRGEGELLPEYLLHGDRTIFDTIYYHHDINSLPLPDYDTPMMYDGDIPKFNPGRMLPYYSSRGCPGQCSFCDVQHQNGNRIRIRRKAGSELQVLTMKYRPDLVFLGDETVPYYDQGWRDSWGDFRYPFYCYIRADIEPEHLEWLIDRGMVGCAFGVESGDEQYRNEVLKKGLTDEQIYRTAAILKQHRKHFVHFYMQGMQGETFAIRKKTEEMKNSLGGFGMTFGYTHIVHDTIGGV